MQFPFVWFRRVHGSMREYKLYVYIIYLYIRNILHQRAAAISDYQNAPYMSTISVRLQIHKFTSIGGTDSLLENRH